MSGWLLPEDQLLLERFTAALDDGVGLPVVLDALDVALKRGGDAAGLWGTVSRSARPVVPSTGFGSSKPADGWFLCPRDRCAGREPSALSREPQTCSAFGGKPLLWKRL